MRYPRHAAMVTVVLLAAALGTAACSDPQGSAQPHGSPRTATGSLEKLATLTACTPNMQIDADELRQGVCTTDAGHFVLTTFATTHGMHDWLREAQAYGGSYLVGRKWVAVADPEVLDSLRDRLGGFVQTVDHGSSGATHPDSGNHGPGGEQGNHGHTR